MTDKPTIKKPELDKAVATAGAAVRREAINQGDQAEADVILDAAAAQAPENPEPAKVQTNGAGYAFQALSAAGLLDGEREGEREGQACYCYCYAYPEKAWQAVRAQVELLERAKIYLACGRNQDAVDAKAKAMEALLPFKLEAINWSAMLSRDELDDRQVALITEQRDSSQRVEAILEQILGKSQSSGEPDQSAANAPETSTDSKAAGMTETRDPAAGSPK